MEDQINEATPPAEEKVETRREMLRKIGIALAATSVASVAAEALGQDQRTAAGKIATDMRMQGAVRLSPDVKTAFTKELRGDYNVFVAIRPDGKASAVVVPENDPKAIQLVRNQLGAPPARATIVGGVIHVDLGVAAAGRCSGNGKGAAVATFNPSGPIERLKQLQGPIVGQ